MPDGTGVVERRTLSAVAEGEPVVDSKRISAQKLADFTESLNRIDFWQAPVQLPPDPHQVVVDGTEWILEGVQDGRYVVLVRGSFLENNFASVARTMFGLAGHKLQPGKL